MGRKLRLCSRKYLDWKRLSPKRKTRVTTPLTLEELHDVIELPQGWHDHTETPASVIRISKICPQSESNQPHITRSIIISSDLSWRLFVHSIEVKKCDPLANIPTKLDVTSIVQLISIVDKLKVCAGHPEKKFIDFVTSRKGKLLNKTGDVTATIDEFVVSLNGEVYERTVRTASCELLIHGQKCVSCSMYRRTLRVLHDRWSKRDSHDLSSSSSHANNRYLNTPEKLTKLGKMRRPIKNAESEISRLKEKVCSSIDKSDPVDEGFHHDLKSVMTENTKEIHKSFPEGTFRHVFWDQPIENAQKKSAKQY